MISRETEAWRLGLAVFGEAFDRAKARQGESLPCRRGCSSCCESAAVFEIHSPDAALLREGLRAASSERRLTILQRAEAILGQLRAAAAEIVAAGESRLRGWDPLGGFVGLTPDLIEGLAAKVQGACPILESDGSCGLHDSRPAICRLQGVAWRDPDTGAELPDFCTLEPRPPGGAVIEGPLLALDDLREQLRIRLARAGESPARTCVASALLAPPGSPPEGPGGGEQGPARPG